MEVLIIGIIAFSLAKLVNTASNSQFTFGRIHKLDLSGLVFTIICNNISNNSLNLNGCFGSVFAITSNGSNEIATFETGANILPIGKSEIIVNCKPTFGLASFVLNYIMKGGNFKLVAQAKLNVNNSFQNIEISLKP